MAQNITLLKRISPRLFRLSSHEAFFLLISLLLYRLLYFFLTAPCFLSDEQSNLDETIKDLLSTISNVKFDNDTWVQASMPVRWGGIGVRSILALAPSAYLASRHATEQLVSRLLPEWIYPF